MSTVSKHLFLENTPVFSDYMRSNGINKTNFPQEFFPILGLFSEDCNYHLQEVYVSGKRLFIKGGCNGKENELMLRFGNSQLIIARVMFIHQRQGNMTHLYKILKKIRKKYKLNPIIMESCITDASVEWSKKNGFELMPDGGSYKEKE
ncbi:MAG: hypothetical protein K5879_03170 [Lachnospiraceae bacterium]|nr:hypothetical protein [Lachnospiraceae bacterium]